MKIRKLELKKFRHFQDTNIDFGNKLTVIAGQNGTGKSSILGWVAQLCDYKGSQKRINNKQFKEKYSNVFRFCPENDFANNYEVIFHYTNNENILATKKLTTRYISQSTSAKARYRVDFDSRGRAINFPVIYLGLKRLVPLATERRIDVKEISLQKTYAKRFSTLAKDILILIDDKINAEAIDSTNKDILAMKTESYSHLGNSAGQDNIGQILSSLLSFRILKDKLGKNYEGGIILIDEIDATLYAGSQIKLIKTLLISAGILNLQIIFTTHSLEILEYLTSLDNSDDVVINYLTTINRQIKNQISPSFNYIANKIKVQIGQTQKVTKRYFICEDDIAEYWCRNMINGTELKQLITIEQGPFSDGTIISMAKSNHNLFKNVGFILDGDVKKKFKNEDFPKKTIFLPGQLRPES